MANFRTSMARWDRRIIRLMAICTSPMARIALFVVFAWFGALKLIDLSPANPLVKSLLEETLPFLTFGQFIFGFGLFEVLIGVLFLIPRLERVAIGLLFLHMVTTFMPLVMLPETSWVAPLVPTLEGQYIIKNLVIIALAMSIAANLDPMSDHRKGKC